MPSLSMVFDVLAIDRASAVFDRVGNSAGQAGAKVEAATASTANAGKKIEAGLAVAAAAAAVYSVKMAADFQQNVTKLATTAGEAQSHLKQVSDGMLQMASQVGIGANDLAKGMYTVESAGFHGANALNVLKAAAEGARQEQADLGKTTDALSTILHDYNIPASQSADVMSKLVTAVSTGKTTLEEFSGSLHSVTPLAAALHVPLADILGSLAAMTSSGESAEQATQNMADALRHLQSPTAGMTAELGQLGITSSDLSTALSTKGLAGTMQEIEQAILQHVDPATQRVLLPAFNQSKTAAQDLATMIGQMPPALAKMSQGLLDGSTNIADYRKAVRGMGGEAGAAGLQFLSLYQASDGFNQILKAGGPAAQVFSAALQKAVGDSAGLTVALQLTGEHAGTVNENIAKIGQSTAQADGNIKGWAEVQGNFNQQLHQTAAGLETMAIQLGQHLLPALTDGLHFINSTVIPGIEHMGSAVGDAAHWFSELPAPVKDAAEALVALKLAEMLGLLSRFSAGLAAVRASFVGFRAEVAGMQMWQNMQAGLAGAEASAGRLGATMSVVGARARSAGSAMLGMVGGPWGLAIAGAVVGIAALNSAIQRHDEEIKKATADVQKWNEAVALGPGGQTAAQAGRNIDDLKQKLADVTAQIDRYNAAAAQGEARGGIGTLIQRQKELRQELAQGEQAWKNQLANMSPVEEKQAEVALRLQDLNREMRNFGDNSPQAQAAADRYRQAQSELAGETERADRAQKTQIQLMQDQANLALGAIDAALASQQAQAQLADAIAQYNKDAADGQHTTAQLKEEQLGLAQQAKEVADAAAKAAVEQAKQNGITDNGTIAAQAELDSLRETAKHLSGPALDAVNQYIAVLEQQTKGAGAAASAVTNLGVTVVDLPNQHMITIDVPTADQMQRLHDLGYVTVTLPNGKVVVTADTNPAMAEIQALLNYARVQAIEYRATLPSLVDNKVASGSGHMGTYAAGGYTGDGGKYTPAGIVHRGEFVMPQEAVNRLGVGFLGALAGLPGYANGGWVGLSPGGTFPVGGASIPVTIDPASVQAVNSAVHQAFVSAASMFTGGGGGAGSPAIRSLGQQIAAAMGYGGQFSAIDYIFSHESGWNPLAQNPTSTAFGIPQFLNSTWAAYGGKTTNAAQQIRDGIMYMRDRYGSPNAAASFWQGHHWYDGGGWLQPGVTMAYNGTGKPERIYTAEQNAALGGPTHVTLQLDRDAVTDLLDGRVVTAVTMMHDRGAYNG